MKYKKVPDIITNKDLIYLEDMHKWNSLALKITKENKKKVQDSSIKELFSEAETIFNNNLDSIMQILERKVNEDK